jgi:hypothetical protein
VIIWWPRCRGEMPKIVYAKAGDVEAFNTYRCCAERIVLEKWKRLAIQKGIPRHAVISWIRRKSGGYLVVQRFLSDNTAGCSVPCVLCRREIEKYDMLVSCTARSGEPFEGKTLPASELTCSQRRMFSAGRG